MKSLLICLAGYWCTTLQFNAFRFAEIKKPVHGTWASIKLLAKIADEVAY